MQRGAHPTASAELDALIAAHHETPSDTHYHLGKQAAKLSRACLPFAEVFTDLAQQTPDARCEFFARRTVQALAACDCQGDPHRILAIALLERRDRTTASTIDFSAPLELPSTIRWNDDATWGEMAPVIFARHGDTTSPFWTTLEPTPDAHGR